MKQRVLFLLTGLMLLANGFVAQGQAIVSPSANSTVNVCGFDITVQGTNPNTRRLIISVFDPNGDDVDGTPFTINRGVGNALSPVTRSVPGSSLNPSTTYTILVEAFAAGNVFLDDTQIDVTTGPSPGSPNPSITAPTNGATGVSTTPTINIAAYAGCGNLTSAIIELDRDLSFTNLDYQQTIDNTGNGPFSWTPPNELGFGTLYYLRVRFLQGAAEVGTTTISFTTQPFIPTSPSVVSPLEGATVSTCSPVVLTVNANNAAARRIRYAVYNWATGPSSNNVVNNTAAPNFQFAEVTITAAQATSSFNLPPIPVANFSNLTDYGIQLETTDAAGNVIGGFAPGYRFAIGPDQTSAAANTPVITAPADGSTVNTFTPTITVGPFAGCQLNSVVYEILLGTVGNTVVSSAAFNTPTFSWTVPSFLTAGDTYRARVTYNVTVNGNPLSYSDVHVFTVRDNPPPQVELAAPTVLTGLNPCGFSGAVKNYPGSTHMLVEYRVLPGGTFSTLATVPFSGVDYPFAFGNTQLQPNQGHELRVTAGTLPGGVFTPIASSANTFTFSTGNIGGNITPVLTSPLNGATDVSTLPGFTFGPYQGDCGAVTGWQVEVVPVGGSGDWNTRVGYKAYNLNNAVFDPVTRTITPNAGDGLLPATLYKLRIGIRVTLNGKDEFLGNYDSVDPGVYTFTTIDPNQTRLDLVVSESNTVEGVIYLNSLVQTIQLVTVSGATEYEIQLSTDPAFGTIAYSATSPTNTFTFNANAPGLESSTLYYIRARVTQPFQGSFSTAANVRSFVNSLHPTFADRPVGNINNNSAPLRGWHARNATSMFFQIATDPAFTNLVDAAGPYGPIAADPATGQIAYERYSYRRWVGFNLTNIPIANANDAGFAPFNTLGEYQYVRWLVPGQTYYIRVKNVRQAANGTYLQLGYWGPVVTFTTPAATRTHTIGIGGAPNNVFLDFFNNAMNVATLPEGVWETTEIQLQVSTDAGFGTIIADQTITNGGPGISPNVGLNYSTDYYARVRSRAANDPAGPTVWTPWFDTPFRTLDAPSGRAAAAATSTDGQVLQNVAFPNPFTESVGVSLKSEYGDVKVSMHDQTGRSVENVQSRGGNTVVMGRQAAKGFYVIRITDRNGLLETLKIVKQ